MATYAEIQEYVRKRYGRGVKPCWIAHVKELNGFQPRPAPNRIEATRRAYPCPPEFRDWIEEAFKHFKMLK